MAAAALTAGPVVLVRGSLSLSHHWQELALYVISIAGGGISAVLGFSILPGLLEIRRQRVIVWGGCLFLFLYVACAALCEKLTLGIIAGDLWRNAGLPILLAGGAARLWAIAALGRFHSALVTIQPEHKLVTTGPYRWLRHPSYFGLLLYLTGVPMVFGAWFPLLAMPGVFVAIKWRILDEEALLNLQFGQEFQSYKQKTWCLIPFLY